MQDVFGTIHWSSPVSRIIKSQTSNRRCGRIAVHARLTRLLAPCVLALLLLWAALPVARAARLLLTSPFRAAPAQPVGLAVRAVQFHAADGVRLRGWLVRNSAAAPTVILIAPFTSNRTSMLRYAHFLHAAGFNVLLYDSRGQ